MGKESSQQSDRLLQTYLRAKGEKEADRALELLWRKVAEPRVRRIARSKLWPPSERQAQEDLVADARLRLIKKLQAVKASPTPDFFSDFLGYVARIATNLYIEYLRKTYPGRRQLEGRLRSLLTGHIKEQKGFELWTSLAGEQLGGFQGWRSQGRNLKRTRRYVQMVEEPESFVCQLLPGESPPHMNPAEILAALFNAVGGPIELDDLVRVFENVQPVPESLKPPVPPDEEDPPDDREISSPVRDPVAVVIAREHLRALWLEIKELPPRQATALLLNLRCGPDRGYVHWLEQNGVATLSQIAVVLDMPADQLVKYADSLPIEDATIAEFLRFTRQDVINLRLTAWKRLAHRTPDWNDEPAVRRRAMNAHLSREQTDGYCSWTLTVADWLAVCDHLVECEACRRRPAQARSSTAASADGCGTDRFKAQLRRLWPEIKELPSRQATALLLNLCAGPDAGYVAWLEQNRLASRSQIAVVLDIPADRLAAIADRLPIEDATIAELLRFTRQDVINLRMAARKRLAHRTRDWNDEES